MFTWLQYWLYMTATYKWLSCVNSKLLNIVYEHMYFLFTANLILLAMNTETNQSIIFTNFILLSQGAQISVACLGQGNISWSTSSFPISFSATNNLYQIYNSLGDNVTLYFKHFDEDEVAVYTCSTQTLGVNGRPITKDILITNCKENVMFGF